MKNIMKNVLFYKAIMCMLILGMIVGCDISNDFIQQYVAKMGQTPIRYSIIVIALFIDYFIFEDINHYIYIFRHKSVSVFIIKSIIYELFVTMLLLITFHLPIMIFNLADFVYNFAIIFLVIVNMIIVFSVILSVIRFINVWVNNRILSTSIFMLMFICVDIILNHYNFFYVDSYIFDFDCILVLPYMYSFYPIVASILVVVNLGLLFVTSKMMKERDYIVKQHEVFE